MDRLGKALAGAAMVGVGIVSTQPAIVGWGAAVVVATHDPEVVELCDRVVRLVDGRPAEPGPVPPDAPGEAGGAVA